MSPPLNDRNLPTFAAFVTRMLVLPNGQVLFNAGLGNQLYAYTPRGSTNPAYLPVIQNVQHGDDGEFTLIGQQLNGPSDASAYGDDAQSNETFPIVRLQDSNGLVFYCRSRDWTSTSVGSIPRESVKFTLNPAVTPGVYQLIVSAGAFDAGATEVLVSDSHGDAQNIDVEALDKRVQLVRSWPRPLLMVQGLDASFDALGLVGYYASQAQFPAVLAHNITSQRIMGIKFNGTTMPDAG